MMGDERSKAGKDADNADPPRGSKGDVGLGTEAGVAQAGDQSSLNAMPEHPGTPKYPDDENPDAQRPHIAPQEGHIEEDPKTVGDASPGVKQ